MNPYSQPFGYSQHNQHNQKQNHTRTYTHTHTQNTAVLLVNLGTPKSLTLLAVYQFLRAFLWDKRVVRLPRWFWWMVLHFIVLPLRTRRVLNLYRNIWMPDGSPLQVFTERLAGNLEKKLKAEFCESLSVFYAMTYGAPNISSVLKKIESLKIARIIIIPLFPQYSSTTTAAIFDKVSHYYKERRFIPSVHFINEYATLENYQNALAQSIQEHWQAFGKSEYLLFSFHGIPVSYASAGDPYPMQCQNLALALASQLNIPKECWGLSFQSRFGYNQWVEPSTDAMLRCLREKGIQSIDLISPSFSVDCLETLEELNIRSREKFLSLGGKCFRYIPALNDSKEHLDVMAALIKPYF